MNNTLRNSLLVSALAALSAPALAATTITNGMTNIATANASCDLVAIGLDFGVLSSTSATVPTATSNQASSTVGRSPSAHPRFNKDGGATDGSAAYITGGGTLTGNDQLSITVPLLGAVDLSTLLQGAGVYAACAGASISSIKVYPRGGTGTAVTLGVGTNTVSSSMDLLDASGNVVTANALNYTTTFVGASTSAVTSALTAVPVVGSTLASAVNAALYPATGTITAGQTPTQGYYAETYRVDLTY